MGKNDRNKPFKWMPRRDEEVQTYSDKDKIIQELRGTIEVNCFVNYNEI